MAFDLKSATPDASFPNGAVLFGADSQSASDPSVYAWSTVRDYLWSLTQTFARGTITDPAPVIDASVTWNDAADTFTGFKLNVTNTASAAASMLMDLQVGGSSIFAVGRAGELLFPGTGDQQYIVQNGQEVLRSASSVTALYTPKSFVSGNAIRSQFDAGFVHFAAQSGNGAITYFEIYGEASDTLAVKRGTNAQVIRIYNTFTDASNYERGFARWATNRFELGAEAAGTGTQRQLGFPLGFELDEQTAPASPAANRVRIYAEDNGSGKTRLMALFPTGSAVQIAIEP